MECKKPITKLECFKAVTELGLDSFSVEFYKTFCPDVKEILLRCLNCSLVVNYLCDFQNEGLITLILKSLKNTL